MAAGTDHDYVRRVVVTLGLVVLVAAGVLLLVLAFDVALLVFAGIIVAVLLRGLAHFIADHTPLTEKPALACAALLVVGVPSVAFWLSSQGIAGQIGELQRTLPQAVADLRERAAQYDALQPILRELPAVAQAAPRTDVLGKITGFFSTTFGALANVLIVLALGAYFAVDPRVYLNGLRALAPPDRRERIMTVLREAGSALAWWITGKFASMAVVGVLTGIGLALLGVPFAVPLALIAALLTFIPNIGPILSVVPAALLALLQAPSLAVYVLLLYAAVQFAETYLITPVIQRRMVSLPPGVTLVAQLLAGVVAGGLGLVLATPLAVVALVLVRRFYLEDVLDESQQPVTPQ